MEEALTQNLLTLLASSTIKIRCGRSYGTAFYVSPQMLVTAKHVLVQIEKGAVIEVLGDSGFIEMAVERVEVGENGVDIAVITSRQPNEAFFCVEPTLALGDELVCLGYPKNSNKLDVVTLLLEDDPSIGRNLTKFKAGQIVPGLSGAPVLNTRTGAICGIVKSTRSRSTDLGGRFEHVSALNSVHANILEESLLAFLKYGFYQKCHVMKSAAIQQIDRFFREAHTNLNVDDSVQIPYSVELDGDETSLLNLVRDHVEERPQKVMFVVGPPGAGKTYFLQSFVVELYKQRATKVPVRVPIFINSAKLAHSSGLGFEEKVENYLKDAAQNLLGGLHMSVEAGFVNEWFSVQSCSWVLVFDSVDEIKQDRRQYIDAICEIAAQTNDRIAVVAASRPITELTALEADEKIVVRAMPDWGDEDIKAFSEGSLGERRSTDFLDNLNRLDLKRYSGNPLMISMLLEVFREDGSVADSETSIFERYIDILLTRWSERASDDGTQTTNVSQYLAIAEHLAWASLNVNETYDSLDAQDVIGDVIIEEAGVSPLLAKRFVESATVALSEERILVRIEHGDVTWPHARVRDYLAASYLIRSRGRWGAIETINNLFLTPGWWDVSVFVLKMLGKKTASSFLERVWAQVSNCFTDGAFSSKVATKEVALNQTRFILYLFLDKVVPDSAFEELIVDDLLQLGISDILPPVVRDEEGRYRCSDILRARYSHFSEFIRPLVASPRARTQLRQLAQNEDIEPHQRELATNALVDDIEIDHLRFLAIR